MLFIVKRTNSKVNPSNPRDAMNDTAEEQILVTPTAVFHEIGVFQGFSPECEKYLPTLLLPENLSFQPRSKMEEDPSFKQLIPYVIFRHTDAEGNVSLFHYTRGKGQGEARLHAKRSIGVGGHISAEDDSADDVYRQGMLRELEEEVNISTGYTESRVGMINDDLTEVGKVHLGVVHVFDCDEPKVTSNETDLIECGFAPVEKLLQDVEQFETWSQITLKALFQ